MSKEKQYYIGHVSNDTIPFIEHIINNTNLDVIEVMNKMNIGDDNRIYIAKFLQKKGILTNKVLIKKDNE